MRHEEFESPEELRDTIVCFWHNQEDYGEQESPFEILPDGFTEIIFYFGSLQTVDLKPLPSPFLMGLLKHPLTLRSRNLLDVIGIRCYPWTVFELLGLPSGKNGVQVFEHPIALLQAELNGLVQAGKIEEVITRLKQYFLDARSGVAVDSMLSKAGVAMRKMNGTLPVSQVAAAAHATVRTLERKFKQSSGHSVKDISGIIRFEKARNHLWWHPDTNLAGLAMELGYTDQSHLSREFKKYSGTTPAAFARQAKKNNYDFVAFVQA